MERLPNQNMKSLDQIINVLKTNPDIQDLNKEEKEYLVKIINDLNINQERSEIDDEIRKNIRQKLEKIPEEHKTSESFRRIINQLNKRELPKASSEASVLDEVDYENIEETAKVILELFGKRIFLKGNGFRKELGKIIEDFKESDKEKSQIRCYELCHKIIEKGEFAAMSLAENIEKFLPKDMSADQRLALCHKIIEKGELSARQLANDFDKFSPKDMTVDQRLDLCHRIVEKGEFEAECLTEILNGLEAKRINEEFIGVCGSTTVMS